MIKKEIDLHADTLRGIAIILVLFVHISAYGSFDNMREELNLIVYLFQNIRLPLFTVLSGFFFVKLRNRELSKEKFFSKKIRNLLIPLYVVISIELILSIVLNIGEASAPIYRYFIYPFDHYWFIQAILIIFTFHFFLSKISNSLLFNALIFIFALAIFFILPGSEYNTNFFSFSGAVYLYPYFVLGTLMPAISNFVRNKNISALLLFISLLLLAFQYAFHSNSDINELFHKRSIMGLVSGMIFTTTLFCIDFEVKMLAKIGKYSFPIYLYQVFGNKLGYIVAIGLLGLNSWLGMVLIIITSITLSIAVEVALKRAKNWLLTRDIRNL